MNLARMNGTLPGTLLCGLHPRIGKTHGEVVVITGSDDRRRRFPPGLNEGSGLQR